MRSLPSQSLRPPMLTAGTRRAYYRYRDREQVLAIMLEANTPRLLHASIATFYQTIHDVANASKLSERVGDIQYFLDDMIKCCETGKTTRADFINLARRHHEKVYYFVRELVRLHSSAVAAHPC